MNHDLYLLVAFLTHAVVGYAVVAGLTDLPPAAGVVGALLPDLDLYLGPGLGLPIVHRGALHTPAALVVLAGGVYLLGTLVDSFADSRGDAAPWRIVAPWRIAAAFAIGFLSHLLVDSATDAGIMWLYPASEARVAVGVPIHGAAGTVALWLASLALVVAGPRLRRRLFDGGPGPPLERA